MWIASTKWINITRKTSFIRPTYPPATRWIAGLTSGRDIASNLSEHALKMKRYDHRRDTTTKASPWHTSDLIGLHQYPERISSSSTVPKFSLYKEVAGTVAQPKVWTRTLIGWFAPIFPPCYRRMLSFQWKITAEIWDLCPPRYYVRPESSVQ